MAVETLYATSLNSGTVTTPNNALGAPDGTFTTDVDNASWSARYEMGNPTGVSATGTHTVTLRVRKETGTGTPTINQVNVITSTSMVVNDTTGWSVTSTTGEDITINFNASVFSGHDLSTVSVEIVTTASGGGPSARSTVQLDAITWSGNFETSTPQSINVLQVTEADSVPLHGKRKSRTMGLAW